MTRFVRMFRYDPIKEPTARLRLDYDSDDGMARLYDEDVLPEQHDNPDARCNSRLSRATLVTSEVRWLATQFAELAYIMERDEICDEVAAVSDVSLSEITPGGAKAFTDEVTQTTSVDAKFDKGGCDG